jgi:ribosome biogenesis GTPase
LDEILDPHFDEEKIMKLPTGRVLSKERGEYQVLHGEHEITCALRSKLRKNLIFPLSRQRRQSVDQVKSIEQVDPVAVGDKVRISLPDEISNLGAIEFIEERINQLSRRDPGIKPRESVICSNVDTLFLVFSVKSPQPKVGLIDRFLVAAEWEFIPVTLILNKTDLDKKNRKVDEIKEIYGSTGYRLLTTSAVTGEGIDDLRNILRDQTSVLAGPSGTGKSSLLNVIEPGLGLKVGEVSDYSGKGRHTTTQLKAFPLSMGGLVMDTPGIKMFALWNLEPEELATLYPEMEPLVGKCKFGLSCNHITEPGCTIKDAVESGKIHKERYESYLRLKDNLDDLYVPDYLK